MPNILGPGWDISGVDCVLFDKDGTFIDSHAYWGEIILRRSKSLIEYFGLSEIALLELQVVMGFDPANKILLPEGPIALFPREVVISHVQKGLNRLGTNSTFEEIEKIFLEVHERFIGDIGGYLNVIDGFFGFASQLKACGVRMAVVTTDSIQNTRDTLEKTNLDSFFDYIVGRESTKYEKASGIPARLAINKLGADPSHTVCVGDAPMDIHMASNSGCMAAIAVTTGQIGRLELQKLTPFVVSNLAHLAVEGK